MSSNRPLTTSSSRRRRLGNAMRSLGGLSLGELADQFGCVVQGDESVRVTHVATLQDADSRALVFVANPKYAHLLAETHAGAAIVSPRHAQKCPIPALVTRNPYAMYARIAAV